jgi:hypothetical protein
MTKSDSRAWIRALARLRHVRRQLEPQLRAELTSIEEELAELVGPTVRPADAASILGLSEPAFKRWLDNGQIASVLTPRGRREVPLPELLDLVEEVERARERGAARPLTRVIRDRTRLAKETVDVDRLLPRPPGRTHRTAELQALAYHRLLAERLDDELVAQARRRLQRWRAARRIDPRWAEEWERVLSQPLEEIRALISADTPEGRQLRQTSPFAGELTEQERRLLAQAVAQRAPA